MNKKRIFVSANDSYLEKSLKALKKNKWIEISVKRTNEGIVLVEILEKRPNSLEIPKGLIELSVPSETIKIKNVILEGTDAVGKTETIKQLLPQGILCRDRESTVFSKYMLKEIPMEERTRRFLEYLKSHRELIVFLINNDEKELLRRVYSRKEINDFDLQTNDYNRLYEETYKYMEEHHMREDKLFLVDCTGLNVEDQATKVKKIILEHHRKI